MPTARAAALVLLFTALASHAGAAPVPSEAGVPPPAPLDPRGLPGPLLIVGGGTLPADARRAFVDVAGKDRAKIVVIPTASADVDDPKKVSSFLTPWEELKPASVVALHTRDAQKANDPAFVKPLTEATAVWFSGGDQNKLTAAYRGTLVEKELHRLHARGGIIGGTSAGAAVMTDLMIAGGTDTARLGDGFGFLPGFVVDQHFVARKREKRLEGVIASHPTRVGLGLDEGTAVLVRGRVARVIGDSTVTVCIAKGAGRAAAADEYKAGSLLDLVQLQRAALNRAAKEPFPPVKPPTPDVKTGALVIVGGGGAGANIWKKFIELAGGPDSTLVVVTTAMEDPLAPESVEEVALKRNGAKHVVALHTRDRKEADDPKFSDVLTKAKGVWFSGGRQWRFVDAYEGTLTEKRFREVLGRGGVIGGSSAGASIQSEFMPRGHPLGNTVMAAEGYERGFGFLPGCAVDQHFFARKRTADMTGLMKRYPQYLGIGIDEGTALVVRGSVAEVIGRTKVAFYDTKKATDGDKDYEEVTVGEKYDLKERKKIK
ncbi:cyanophycinase [Gemmata sp. JC673]|uniref:Cyanophycinase n=1 Tax=Gemmata algarum TaxID=2975278 RepID=A0ABU5F4R7_9BACT|nr:cyanophycinase [Gemmata algarum]MDY3562479.1 cyanophycinase [Gemmata algarum]